MSQADLQSGLHSVRDKGHFSPKVVVHPELTVPEMITIGLDAGDTPFFAVDNGEFLGLTPLGALSTGARIRGIHIKSISQPAQLILAGTVVGIGVLLTDYRSSDTVIPISGLSNLGWPSGLILRGFRFGGNDLITIVYDNPTVGDITAPLTTWVLLIFNISAK